MLSNSYRQVKAARRVETPYEAMSVDELKKRMAAFGMKTGSKAYMVQELTAVDQLRKDYEKKTEPEVDKENSIEFDRAVIAFLKQDHEIWEKILLFERMCYRSLHAHISKTVPCTQRQLKVFMDKYGVIWTQKAK